METEELNNGQNSNNAGPYNKHAVRLFSCMIFLPVVLFMLFSNNPAEPRDTMLFSLFAVGCAGVYSLFCDRIHVSLGKYRAEGSIAVALLLLGFYYVNTDQKQVPLDRLATDVPAFREPDSTLNLMNQDVRSIGTFRFAQAYTQPCRIRSIRIVYPLGGAEAKKAAIQMLDRLEEACGDTPITIYAMGNGFTALFRKLAQSRPVVQVAFQDDVSQVARQEFIALLKNTYTPTVTPALRHLGEEEVILKIGA